MGLKVVAVVEEVFNSYINIWLFYLRNYVVGKDTFRWRVTGQKNHWFETQSSCEGHEGVF